MKKPWAYNPPKCGIHIRNPNKGPKFLNQVATLPFLDPEPITSALLLLQACVLRVPSCAGGAFRALQALKGAIG